MYSGRRVVVQRVLEHSSMETGWLPLALERLLSVKHLRIVACDWNSSPHRHCSGECTISPPRRQLSLNRALPCLLGSALCPTHSHELWYGSAHSCVRSHSALLEWHRGPFLSRVLDLDFYASSCPLQFCPSELAAIVHFGWCSRGSWQCEAVSRVTPRICLRSGWSSSFWNVLVLLALHPHDAVGNWSGSRSVSSCTLFLRNQPRWDVSKNASSVTSSSSAICYDERGLTIHSSPVIRISLHRAPSSSYESDGRILPLKPCQVHPSSSSERRLAGLVASPSSWEVEASWPWAYGDRLDSSHDGEEIHSSQGFSLPEP